MDSVIKFIKTNEASKVAALIEKFLNKKALGIIHEQRAIVVEKIYGNEELDEANSSSHTEHPLHDTLTKHGYKFDHTHKSPMGKSKPIVGGSTRIGSIYRHIYQHPTAKTAEKRYLSLNHHVPFSKKTGHSFDWDHPYSSRTIQGKDKESLEKHIASHE